MTNQHDSEPPPCLADKWEPTRRLFRELGLLEEQQEPTADETYRTLLGTR
jgi:hypothetical protein